MTRKQKRLSMIGGAGAVLGLAALLVTYALRDNIVFFLGPTDIAEKQVAAGTRLRIGGLVKTGSVERGQGQTIRFVVTDGKSDVAVSYTGLVPDLFREGQGVVVEGVVEAAQQFRADTVLARHDETYMPREVADALKKQGQWKPEALKR
jgi:cytochrome c-type biogenesis protein CcmE